MILSKMNFDRTVVTFFALFLVVYFLESIGGFYMTSAIVSIERQFQIPSKISGLMVSAGDFGYIPSVVFVSYLGGKGNRARWIGGGCVAIAISNLMISSSNFLFPVETISLNTSILSKSIERNTRRLDPENANFAKFLLDLSPEMREKIQQKFTREPTAVTPSLRALAENYEDVWLDEFDHCDTLEALNRTDSECNAFYAFLKRHNSATKADVDNLRLLSSTSYAFCDLSLNHLRSMIQKIRCGRNVSNFGPTATIFLGLLLLGVGRTMPFSLGLPLMDDNVKKRNLPIYFAGLFFIRIMGPVIGFIMGSLFNKFYYTSNPPQGITPKDPMWIGMWWGGFLVIGVVLFGPSLALFFFRAPEEDDADKSENTDIEKIANESSNGNLDNAKEVLLIGKTTGVVTIGEKEMKLTDKNTVPIKKKTPSRKLALVDRHVEKRADGSAIMPETIGAKVHDFLNTISGVVKQPIYIGCLTGRIIDVMAFKGFHIFLPKYLEIQFGIPQYKINMYMGIIGVVGFAFGVIVGSAVLRVFKLEGRRVATWVAICSGTAACLSFMNANVGCRSTLTALGDAIPSNFNANSSCLQGCGCDGVPLYPVCDLQGRVYYSPCHAGCRLDESFTTGQAGDPFDTKNSPVFNRCKCTGPHTGVSGFAPLPNTVLAAENAVSTSSSGWSKVSRDFCKDEDCDWKVKLYFANMAAGGIVGGMGVIPGILIMLRSVPPKHRSVSLGFNGFLVSLLATLPSPIMWGTVIDYFCIYWDKKCDGRGACSLYATDRLRIWLHCIYGTLRLIALITDIYVIFYAKDLKIAHAFGADDEQEEKSEKNEKTEFSTNNKERDNKDGKKANGEADSDCGIELLRPEYSSHERGSSLHSRKHSRNASRDLHHSTDFEEVRSEDLRKSSSHIAGPMSDF